ncbi:MAG: primosomal protein N', partial [Bacteroidota bacterium]
MQHFINVILPIPLPNLFTYTVSPDIAKVLSAGMRVAVPFGKSKIYTALVHEIHMTPPEVYEAKEIHDVLDEYPLVGPVQLAHWKWIADYYMCTLGEVFRTALPSAFLLESETLVLKNEEVGITESELKDDEFLVYEALQHQSTLKVSEVAAIIDRKNALPVLNRLLKKNVVRLKEEIFAQYRPKLVRYITLGSIVASQ